MSPILPPDDALLGRYIAGRATADERARVSAWLAEDASRHEEVTWARRAWAVTPLDIEVPDEEVARVWADVRHQTLDARPMSDPPRVSSDRNRIMRWLPWRRGILFALAGGGVAAAALFLVRAVTRSSHGETPEAVVGQVYRTAVGQRATVRLLDGSTVTLAPQTTLTVSRAFLRDTRTVALIGEAHFDIAPVAGAPFTVRTGSVTTRVLGTVFDLRCYPGDPDGRVSVTSGKVATSRDVHAVTLTAGMVGRFTDSTVMTASGMDYPEMYADWTRGRLVFRNVPVSSVLTALQRWYGYTFRLADSTVARQHVTAEFTMGASAEMLRVMQHILGVRMEFADTVVTLRPDTGSRSTVPRWPKTAHFHATAEVGR